MSIFRIYKKNDIPKSILLKQKDVDALKRSKINLDKKNYIYFQNINTTLYDIIQNKKIKAKIAKKCIGLFKNDTTKLVLKVCIHKKNKNNEYLKYILFFGETDDGKLVLVQQPKSNQIVVCDPKSTWNLKNIISLPINDEILLFFKERNLIKGYKVIIIKDQPNNTLPKQPTPSDILKGNINKYRINYNQKQTRRYTKGRRRSSSTMKKNKIKKNKTHKRRRK